VRKSPGGSLGLLQQAVHGLDEGIAEVIDHPAHHGIEALFDRGGNLFEELKPAAPCPTQPDPQGGGCGGDVVVRSYPGVNLAQRHLQPPDACALERRVLQPVHGVELCAAPSRGVAPHAPHQLPEGLGRGVAQRFAHRRRILGHLATANLVRGFNDYRHHMEAVVADLSVGQRDAHALGIGRAHVHAHMLHIDGVAAALAQILNEVQHALMAASISGKEQPLAIQVVDHGDVVLTTLEAGHVRPHDRDPREALQGPGLLNIELDAAPKLLVRAAQQLGGLAYGQVPAQSPRQGLKGCREPRARTGLGYRGLRGLAAARAGYAWKIAVQPRL
jgi:hypothetical protein